MCRILKTAFGRLSSHGGEVCCYSSVHFCSFAHFCFSCVHLCSSFAHFCFSCVHFCSSFSHFCYSCVHFCLSYVHFCLSLYFCLSQVHFCVSTCQAASKRNVKSKGTTNKLNDAIKSLYVTVNDVTISSCHGTPVLAIRYYRLHRP